MEETNANHVCDARDIFETHRAATASNVLEIGATARQVFWMPLPIFKSI